jgi:hypothetical protein
VLAGAALVAAIAAGGVSAAPRVVGGTSVQIQSAPWTVFIRYDFGSATEVAVCTGSVIDASHVLTAAHCLYHAGTLATPASLSVEAGVSNVVAPLATDAEQERSVSSFRVHPGYIDSTAETAVPDDVAVLALSSPLDLGGPAVRAVALPVANQSFPQQANVMIAGFGLEDPSAHFASGALESMTAAVDQQALCGDYTQTTLMWADNAVLLCPTSQASAACSGDSGSGVVTTGGTPTLLAVADASPAGCPIGSPVISAYAGAPEILAFIQGDDQPPSAPRPAPSTIPYQLNWAQPLAVGATLTCSAPHWPASVTIAYAFVNAATGQVLQTGTNDRYLVPMTSVGMSIACVTSLATTGGTAVVWSNATPEIAPRPQTLKIQRPVPISAKQGRTATLHVVLTGQAGLSGRFNVCAKPPASVAAKTCRSSQKTFGPSATIPIVLHLRVKSTAALGTTHVAITVTTATLEARSTAVVRIAKA